MTPATRSRATSAAVPLRATFLATWALWAATAVGLPVQSQAPDRIWGTVLTNSGERHEGFVQWRGRGAQDGVGWTDFFDGRAEAMAEHYEEWLVATGAGRPIRSVEVRGWRVSWYEEDPDFPQGARAPIRFGRLASVAVMEDGSLELAMRPSEGEAAWPGLRPGDNAFLGSLSPRGEALGVSRPRGSGVALVVEEPGADRVRVAWSELERVDFASAPAGAQPRSSRLHGTVEDRFGRAFTGYVAWDSDEVLESEVLDGWDDEGEDREIPFAEIRSIERSLGGARVVLKSGEALELSGTNDVDEGNRGVRVFDRSIGMVEVEWDEFGVLRLHPAADEQAEYGSFPGSRPLFGTVATQDGDSVAGRIRWDGEHEWSWEILHGRSDEVKFSIEFGRIERIDRGEEAGARVTLVDGRALELSGAPDVDGENRGIFVFPGTDGAPWRYVPWEEFRYTRFRRGTDGEVGSSQGTGSSQRTGSSEGAGS